MTQHQPDRLLINKNGDITTGLFEDTVARINGRDYDYRTPLGKPASRRARHFHYKQFQYFGVVSDELLIGCAFADTAYLGMVFFYVFDTRTGALSEHTWRSPDFPLSETNYMPWGKNFSMRSPKSKRIGNTTWNIQDTPYMLLRSSFMK